MELFLSAALLIALGMLVWDCVEVGRNDAANLVNAVFGSRVMRRKVAVIVAGVAVVLGASTGEGVLETARSGIFDPGKLGTIHAGIAVYISVYVVDTVLLYSFSAFGLPVSTTACLVFELAGAALALAGPGAVNWGTLGNVFAAIFVSILVAGAAGFLFQRVFRGAIGQDDRDERRVYLHGPWIAGAMLTWLSWFMVVKGLQNVWFIKPLNTWLLHSGLGAEWILGVLLGLWVFYGTVVALFLALAGSWGRRNLFAGTAVIGMLCMAFAFGQNDLANCASPGLSTIMLWQHRHMDPTQHASVVSGEFEGEQPTRIVLASKEPIPTWGLFLCGLFIFAGMLTRNAQRVTRAAANTASQFDQVHLYAPEWCRRLARFILRWIPRSGRPLVPEHIVTETGKRVHFDRLRASVIMAVSGSVIALASSRKMPVSTTYVTFAAIIFTGFADRVFVSGDADLKLGRALWVLFSWIFSGVVAVVAAGAVALLIYELGLVGLGLGLVANLTTRYLAQRAADAQEQRVHGPGTVDLDEERAHELPFPEPEPERVGPMM